MTATVIRARGHERVTATHAKTFELVVGPDIGDRATCVIGVAADVDWDALAHIAGPVQIKLQAAGATDTVLATASPFWTKGHGLVVRRSDYRGDDTLAIDADAGAADLDRSLIAALQDPDTELTVTIRPLDTADDTASDTIVLTDQREHAAVDAIRVDGLTPTDAMVERVAAADTVLARPGIPAIAAALAVLGVSDDAVALGPLPKAATARRARLAIALHRAAGLVSHDLAVLDDVGERAFAIVVHTGEAVVPVTRQRPKRIAADATVTVAIAGDAATDDLAPVLQALVDEGVSPRTLRDALARVPQLGDVWDYDALLRLKR